MAVLFAELGLNIIWPYQEKLGPIIFYRNRERNDRKKTLMHHQSIIPAFAGTGSAALPSIAPPPAYAGAGLRRLTSNTLLVIRNAT
jgi:hypothetical protein